MIKKLPLGSMMLFGNPLPWVSKKKHLGITVTDQMDGCQEDMAVKNAKYIAKNNKVPVSYIGQRWCTNI